MNDLLVFLHNVAEQLPLGQGGNPLFCRVPRKVRDALNETAQMRALDAAGAEVRLRCGSGGGSIRLWIDGDAPQRAEVYLGDHFLWTFNAGPGVHEVPLSADVQFPWMKAFGEDATAPQMLTEHCPRHRFAPALFRICFPYKARVGLLSVDGDLEPAGAADLPGKTLLCYGSSITQGVSALAAQTSSAPRLAWHLGMDLRNLGFGGSAHCEPELADFIVEEQEKWDLATLEMGINMRGFSEDDFEQRMRAFVSRICSGCPERPVLCMDLFRHFGDLPGGNVDKTRAFRKAVRRAHEELGHNRSAYLCLAEWPSWKGMGADLLHPSEAGMEEMALALAECVTPHLRQLGR